MDRDYKRYRAECRRVEAERGRAPAAAPSGWRTPQERLLARQNGLIAEQNRLLRRA